MPAQRKSRGGASPKRTVPAAAERGGVPSGRRSGAATRRQASPASPRTASDLLDRCFPRLTQGRGSGLGVVVGVLEVVPGCRDRRWIAREFSGSWLRSVGEGGRRGRNRGVPTRTSQALAAVGHPHRMHILRILLDGAAVYRTLAKVTGLKPGPLYHHVSQLRMAGLVMPKQRDIYELTRAGRDILLVALALEPMLKDTRRRPMPVE